MRQCCNAVGVLYFVSCTVNPILYNVMSRRFRQAFVETICGARRDTRYNAVVTQRQPTHAATARTARRRSISSEMIPSPHHGHQHHHQQQQQLLLMSNVCVHDAGKMTVHGATVTQANS